MNLIEDLQINLAQKSDLMDVFSLANDKVTRKNSLNQKQIKLEEHIKWFKNKIACNDCIFYIVRTSKNEFVGYVRFDRDPILNHVTNVFIISISLSENFRGNGLGTIIVKHVSDIVLKDKRVDEIYAHIKTDNDVSLRCFLKSGYTVVNQEKINDSFCYKLKFY